MTYFEELMRGAVDERLESLKPKIEAYLDKELEGLEGRIQSLLNRRLEAILMGLLGLKKEWDSLVVVRDGVLDKRLRVAVQERTEELVKAFDLEGMLTVRGKHIKCAIVGEIDDRLTGTYDAKRAIERALDKGIAEFVRTKLPNLMTDEELETLFTKALEKKSEDEEEEEEDGRICREEDMAFFDEGEDD